MTNVKVTVPNTHGECVACTKCVWMMTYGNGVWYGYFCVVAVVIIVVVVVVEQFYLKPRSPYFQISRLQNEYF